MPIKLHLWSPRFSGFGGGIGKFSQELAIALDRSGVDLRLVGRGDISGRWNGLPLSGSGRLPRRIQPHAFALKAAAAALRLRPDLLISAHLNFGPVANGLKSLWGIPYVLVAHGVDVHEQLSRARRRALRRALAIWAVSEWTRERLQALAGVDGERIFVLPNTFDENAFDIGRKPRHLAARYGFQPDEKVILTVARLDPNDGYKGYDRILASLPAVRAAIGGVRYLVVGDGPDSARIESLAGELGVADAVTLAGFVPDEEMADHYRLADVFAMPSTGEGFGIVFLEAMGCGTPVLAGDRDGSVDALDGGRLGRLVDPMDQDQIAAGLIALLTRDGPDWWFEPRALRDAVVEKYGRAAFQRRVGEVLEASLALDGGR